MIKKHKGERVHPCSVCDPAFKSFPMLSQHKSQKHRGHVFVCEGCGKTFKTNDSCNRHKKLVCVILMCVLYFYRICYIAIE